MVFDIFHTDKTEWHFRKQGPAIAMVANLAINELHAALGIHPVADGDDGIQVVKNNGFVGIWNVHFLHIAFFGGRLGDVLKRINPATYNQACLK